MQVAGPDRGTAQAGARPLCCSLWPVAVRSTQVPTRAPWALCRGTKSRPEGRTPHGCAAAAPPAPRPPAWGRGSIGAGVHACCVHRHCLQPQALSQHTAACADLPCRSTHLRLVGADRHGLKLGDGGRHLCKRLLGVHPAAAPVVGPLGPPHPRLLVGLPLRRHVVALVCRRGGGGRRRRGGGGGPSGCRLARSTHGYLFAAPREAVVLRELCGAKPGSAASESSRLTPRQSSDVDQGAPTVDTLRDGPCKRREDGGTAAAALSGGQSRRTRSTN